MRVFIAAFALASFAFGLIVFGLIPPQAEAGRRTANIVVGPIARFRQPNGATSSGDWPNNKLTISTIGHQLSGFPQACAKQCAVALPAAVLGERSRSVRQRAIRKLLSAIILSVAARKLSSRVIRASTFAHSRRNSDATS